MQQLAGRTAFVTGAAGGIGLALARALAAEGMNVALADIDEAGVTAAAAAVGEAGRSSPVRLDVTDFADWTRAIRQVEESVGKVDLLVNNAGIGGGANVADEDPARWRRVIEVNAIGTFHGCRAVLPAMLARGREAHVVNVASLSGLRSNPGMSSYDASKAAVVGLTDSLRQELAGTRIGLSLVYPGMTRTRFVENSRHAIARAAGVKPDPDSGVGDMLAGGMDPAQLARRVVAGVKAGEYHIFTHADWKPIIRAVFDERVAAFGENADPDYREDIAALQARIARTQRAAAGGTIDHQEES